MIGKETTAGAGEDRDLSLPELVAELIDRLQAGGGDDLEQYFQAHPKHADHLRQLLRPIQALIDLAQERAQGWPHR